MLVQIWLIGRALSLCLPLLWTFGPTASFGRRKFIVMRGVITCWPVLRRKTGGEVCRFCGQNHLLGPFVPISDGPITPPEWESLDGTLYLDGQGRPWLIFCHEWTQLGDGAICGMRLEKDLSAAAEAPVTLFHASQSGWSVADTGQIVRKTGENYVTDGPFLHRCEDGTLWMLWSSYARCGYAVGLAKSLSGDIPGPWQHLTKPLFERNGGHGMLFRTLKGQLRLAIHRPNDTPWERPCFLPVEEKTGG